MPFKVIQKYCKDVYNTNISYQSKLTADLGLDSLDLTEIMLQIETKYNLSNDLSEKYNMDKLNTVSDLVNLYNTRINASNPQCVLENKTNTTKGKLMSVWFKFRQKIK